MKYKNFSIDFFGTKFRIEFVDDMILIDDKGCWGITDSVKGIIKVATTANGRQLSQEEIRLTLYHELVHAIFFAGLYHGSNEDEPLVEWLAKCLNQLYKKGVFK
jgi:hypothetical protein